MTAEHNSDFLPESSSVPRTFSRFAEVFHLHPCHINRYSMTTLPSLNFWGFLFRELQEFQKVSGLYPLNLMIVNMSLHPKPMLPPTTVFQVAVRSCQSLSTPSHSLSMLLTMKNIMVLFCPNFNNSPHPDTRSAHAFTDLSPVSLNLGHTPRRGPSRRSGNSSMDFTDVSGPLETEYFGLPHKNLYGSSRCGLCGRYLSQRSPWGSRRMVWSGDMPITGVLSCWHVFHAECLERVTPKPQKHDPPCPVCEKSENGNGVEQWAICRLKNGLPRLRSLGEEGPSRVWSCGQAGDSVEGAIDVPNGVVVCC